MTRQFQDEPAQKKASCLLIGLTAASGGGKTWSALELATGIVSVTGGEIWVVDTDNARSLHYADYFKFRYVGFPPPHSSAAYVDAIAYCHAKSKPGDVIILDGASAEHEGEGGMLEFHESEWQRMGGKESTKMLAWAKPKAARRQFIQAIQRRDRHMIICSRAKEGVKLTRTPGGKMEVVQQGFTPIAADELIFECDLNILLMPASRGVATWDPAEPGERKMTKLPRQFENLRERKAPLDAKLGAGFAKWALGGVSKPAAPPLPETDLPPPDEPETRQGSDDGGTRAATPEQIAAARDAAAKRQASSSGPEPGPGPDNRGQPSREERLAERGFSGEGLATAGDAFPGDRPQHSAAGEPKAADRPASPAAGSETDSPATAKTAEKKPTPSAAESDFGFVDLANALAEGKEWPDLVAALQSLTKGEAWKHSDDPMKARARAAVFMRLKELMKDGLRFDFTDDAHAFRCYIEHEPEGPTLRGNFGAFKLSKSYAALPDPAKGAFDKAVAARLAIIEPADGAAPSTEGDFN